MTSWMSAAVRNREAGRFFGSAELSRKRHGAREVDENKVLRRRAKTEQKPYDSKTFCLLVGSCRHHAGGKFEFNRKKKAKVSLRATGNPISQLVGKLFIGRVCFDPAHEAWTHLPVLWLFFESPSTQGVRPVINLNLCRHHSIN